MFVSTKFGLLDNKKMTFIINPISGVQTKGKLFENEIKTYFSSVNYDLTFLFTEHAGHAYTLAIEHMSSSDIIVAAGGDGTINEVAKALVHKNDIILGIIPAGSGNGLARSLGIPLDLRGALQRIKKGTSELIDTCTFNEIPFFCTAGIGFDAEVAKDFDLLPERGLKTYFQASFKQFNSYKNTIITSKIDGKEIREELFMIAIANAKQYGYGAKISPLSSLSDGKLEVVKIKRMNLPQFAEFSLRLFIGTVQNFKGSEVISTADEIYISSSSKRAHVDGEPIEFNGKVTVKLLPSSLRIIH